MRQLCANKVANERSESGVVISVIFVGLIALIYKLFAKKMSKFGPLNSVENHRHTCNQAKFAKPTNEF